MPETISTQPESEMHLDFYSAFEQQRINAWKKTTPSKVQKGENAYHLVESADDPKITCRVLCYDRKT